MAWPVRTGTVDFSTTILSQLATSAILRAQSSQFLMLAARPAPMPCVFVGVFTAVVLAVRSIHRSKKQGQALRPDARTNAPGGLTDEDHIRLLDGLIDAGAEEQVLPAAALHKLLQAGLVDGQLRGVPAADLPLGDVHHRDLDLGRLRRNHGHGRAADVA
eukprot:scaffold7381_cov310-Pinguiococcus_pyrenoidosus.AAC.14